jgi:hypothetical protein
MTTKRQERMRFAHFPHLPNPGRYGAPAGASKEHPTLFDEELKSMSTSLIGAAVTRVDGPLKVTGAARYAVDHPLENVALAWPWRARWAVRGLRTSTLR